jgi:2-polyprenyl-6-methoxyphenol hydroxylase-like FAD-dependent oxidoreductase
MRIACVGGGPAGLYFALLMKLHEPGHDIAVFERNAAGSAHGWGVTFGSDLLEKLYRGDQESAAELDRAAFRHFSQVVDIHGEQVPYPGECVYSISRQRLLDVLAVRAQGIGVRIDFEREVTAPSQLPDADLVVACDGVHSRTRDAAGAFQTDVRLGGNKYLWLGTDKVFDAFTYAFASTDSGWVWAYGYGVDAESSTLIVECSARTWRGLGFDTMPSADCLAILEKLFDHHLHGHQLAGQATHGANAEWLNFRTVTNRRWYDGNIVLTGDAAHTTHFSIGSGTTLAIEDAVALAGSLQRHGPALDRALESYENQRKAALLQPQSDARFSAQWFENLARYVDLEPREFSALLHGRRSPLLPHLPPQFYYRLHHATQEIAVLRQIRRRVAPRAKAIYSRREPPRAGDGTAAPEPVHEIELDGPCEYLSSVQPSWDQPRSPRGSPCS